MIVVIQEHSYDMSNKEFNKFVKQLKKCTERKPRIFAVIKNNVAQMRNDQFENQKSLNAAIQQWHENGYDVKFARGI